MPEGVPEPPKRDTLFPKLKRWGGVVSVIVGLGGFVGTVWKTITYIDELHDTIGENKRTLQALRTQLDEDHDELEDRISTVALAVRTQRDRDQDVITNLRIAVAALQASQGVREGRLSYGGVRNDRLAVAEPPRPPSARVRREQEAAAQRDASAALRRAERIQATADEEDPLAALEGL